MSRYKFRIWDKTKNEWLGASDKNSVTFKDFDLCGENDDCYGISRVTANKFGSVIEQYTGLKDKNGKEIYEGDIVRVNDDYEAYGIAAGETYEVYFHNGGFRCKPKADYAIRRGDSGYWIECGRDFEVIGNIHENPELLPRLEKNV